MAQINAKFFGVVGDGVTDDRSALQSALDAAAGGDLLIPNGVYALGQAPGGKYYSLKVPPNTRVHGESQTGCRLVQLPVPGSVRMLQVEGDSVLIESMTLDGNAGAMPADEHRAGVFAMGSGLTLSQLTAVAFSGDGIYLYTGERIFIDRVVCVANRRNGITLGGPVRNVVIRDCELIGNTAQQLDSEPGTTADSPDNVSVVRCLLDAHGASGDYVLAIAGSGAARRTRRWNVSQCEINGPVIICWADDVLLAECWGGHSVNKPAVRVYRACDRITMRDCELELFGPSSEVIDITGTGAGQCPQTVRIKGCHLRANGVTHGISVNNALAVFLTDNDLTGNGVAAPYVSGVYIRCSLAESPIGLVSVHGGTISDFGQYGVSVNNAPGCATEQVSLRHVRFMSSTNSMRYASGYGLGVTEVIHDQLELIGAGLLGPIDPLKMPPGVGLTIEAGKRWRAP